MAEETQTESAAKKPRAAKKSRASKKKSRPSTRSYSKEAQALATEQPVPSAPQKKTSQYVVTVDNQTGLPVKIEKLEHTGKRKELTKEEYGQALAYSGLSSPFSAGSEDYASASPEELDSLTQAYYQGVTDYINALTSDE